LHLNLFGTTSIFDLWSRPWAWTDVGFLWSFSAPPPPIRGRLAQPTPREWELNVEQAMFPTQVLKLVFCRFLELETWVAGLEKIKRNTFKCLVSTFKIIKKVFF